MTQHQSTPVMDGPTIVGSSVVEMRCVGTGPYPPAATPEDEIAREAVALVEEQEGYRACAEHRRRGAYDGDTEHSIALAAIRLFKERGHQSQIEAGQI